MHKILKFDYRIIIILIMISSTFSCVPVKKLTYINDINELQAPIVNPKEHKLIAPFDKLYVKVYSIDEKTNLLFGSNENMMSSSSPGMVGYLVDEAGNINFPFVGKIHVAGISTNEAGVKINESLNEYVPTASVIVRFIENNVSVIGEVLRQGNYTFAQDKINIYEALSLGGGISSYGNRKKVILVRQEGDKIMHHKLDLSDSRIAEKEYYYIQSNDVIIVEPLRQITTSIGATTYTLFLSSLSTIITIILLIRTL